MRRRSKVSGEGEGRVKGSEGEGGRVRGAAGARMGGWD